MTVAQRYASAALAAHKGPTVALQPAAAALREALKTPEIAAAFANPRLSPAQRKQLATSAAKAVEAPLALKNLLGVLAANRRLDLTATVLDELLALLAKEAGITPLEVHTAVSLSDMQKIQLKVMVKTHEHSKDVALREVLRPELLGGFRAFWGGLVWDESVAGRLNRLKAKLNTALQQ